MDSSEIWTGKSRGFTSHLIRRFLDDEVLLVSASGINVFVISTADLFPFTNEFELIHAFGYVFVSRTPTTWS